MEIIPGVHVIDLGVVQAYLCQDADRLTLIDTGLGESATAIGETITSIGRNLDDLRQIVVTHYHSDHMGALAELVERSGAQVLAHALDAQVVRGDEFEEAPEISDLERPFYEEVSKSVAPARRCPVDQELVDGDEIDLDGGAKVVHVPGHTAGSIAIYVPKRRVLFAGDAAARMPDGRLIVGVFNVDPARARVSFGKLAQLDFDVVCFGHGAPMGKDASRAFRRLAEKLS